MNVKIKNVRLYTGNGFEDFEVGKYAASYVSHDHSEFGPVVEIKIYEGSVSVFFNNGDAFHYDGLNYRVMYEK